MFSLFVNNGSHFDPLESIQTIRCQWLFVLFLIFFDSVMLLEWFLLRDFLVLPGLDMTGETESAFQKGYFFNTGIVHFEGFSVVKIVSSKSGYLSLVVKICLTISII